MNEQILWMLVHHTQEQKHDAYRQTQQLIELLSEWSISNILKFEKIYWNLMERSFDADLWATAFVLNDGCSQKDFLHFRNWLLLQGQATFRKTIEDPETIINWLELPIQNSIHYPDLQNKIAELVAVKTEEPIQYRFNEDNFDLSGDFWQNDLEIVDKVPILCQRMGWGNQISKGEWKTDDTPRYNSAASGSYY